MWSAVATSKWTRRLQIVALPILVSIPVLLVITAVRQGIALDWDAVVYLSAADSYAVSGRLIDFRGIELTTFAPGLPVLEGVLMRLGAEPNAIGLGLGLSSVLVVGLGTFAVSRWVLRPAALALVPVAVVCLSVSTVRVSSYLKTDAPFSALMMIVAVLCLWAIRERRSPWWWILAVGLTASVATSMRYIGFVLIPTVAVAVVLAHRDKLRRTGPVSTVVRVAVLAGIGGAVAGVGLAAVAFRNHSLGAPALGLRRPSGLSLPDVLGDLTGVLGAYVVPAVQPALPQQLLGLTVVALVGLGAVVALILRSAEGAWLAILVTGYLVALIYSEINTVIQPVSERLMAPVFPYVVILVTVALTWLGRRLASGQAHRALGSPGGTSVATMTCLAAFVALLCVTGSASVSFATTAMRKGIGYNSVAAQNSPTRSAIKQLPTDAGLAGMNGPSIYLAVRRGPIQTVPWINYYNRGSTAPKVDRLKVLVEAGRVDYIVYFNRDRRAKVVTAKQLKAAGLELQRVGDFRDGEIWRAVG